jgi:diamine N-acetyltransferase
MIKGNYVYLRALEPSDVDLMMIYENDTELWPVSGTLSPYSRFTLEQYYLNAMQDIYSTRQIRLAIELIGDSDSDTSSNQTIGFVDLFDFDPLHQRAGVGILIGDKKQRKLGYASEALILLIRYSFETLNLHQLYCHIENTNEASLKLFGKVGFRICGVLCDWVQHSAKWHDVTLMQYIRPEARLN